MVRGPISKGLCVRTTQPDGLGIESVDLVKVMGDVEVTRRVGLPTRTLELVTRVPQDLQGDALEILKRAIPSRAEPESISQVLRVSLVPQNY
jgi:hypothetical protein